VLLRLRPMKKLQASFHFDYIPGTDVIILENIFAEKFGKNIAVNF
jgi:hypothetical protein